MQFNVECFFSQLLETNAKTSSGVCVASVQSQNTAKQSAENVQHSEVAEVAPRGSNVSDMVNDKGHGTAGAAVICQQCSQDPCSCGVERNVDVKDKIDSDDKRVEPAVVPTVKVPSTCDVCGKALPDQKRLKQHMNTHSEDGPVQCSVCGRTFAQRIHLNSHIKMHAVERPFSCDQCGVSFAQKNYLTSHMRVHQTAADKEASTRMSASKQEMHRCPKCGEMFSNKWRLQRHKTSKHRTRPPLKTRPSSRCVCPVCGKSLLCRLSTHMRVHTGQRPYQCPTCGKSFMVPSKLKYHVLRHTGVRPQVCPECGKSYQHLHVHMQLKHGDPDMYQHECPVCRKKFLMRAMLRDHLMLHSGERPYQCFTCGRRFLRQSALIQHERRQHVAEPVVRQRRECEVCHVELSAKGLKDHMLIHSGDKPHGCEWCGGTFRRKDHLRVHCERVHSVELSRHANVESSAGQQSTVQTDSLSCS